MRRAFIVYLLSHNRPMAEILAPKRKSITEEYHRGFVCMTAKPVSIDELTTVREELIAAIVGRAPEPHRRFLTPLSVANPTGLCSTFQVPAIFRPSAGGNRISTNSQPPSATYSFFSWRRLCSKTAPLTNKPADQTEPSQVQSQSLRRPSTRQTFGFRA